MTVDISRLGERALRLHCGRELTATALAQFARHLREQGDALGLAGLEDVVPAERSLLLVFDAAHQPLARQRRALRQALAGFSTVEHGQPTVHRLPVCYDDEFAPDLPAIARAAGISKQDAIELHTGQAYTVQAVGFAPGFAYLGSVDPRIAAPRLTTPRQRVPAGAVGIADMCTAVYPAASPGGWNIIGRCPALLFDARRDPPSTLQAGDRVEFHAIARDEFDALAEAR